MSEAFPELLVEVTLHDVETWQLSQSSSQPNGYPLVELHDIETWQLLQYGYESNGYPKFLAKWMPQMLVQH